MQMAIASRWLICQAAKSVCVIVRTSVGLYYDFRQKNGSLFYAGRGAANMIPSPRSGANDG
jgi:hypothetical protein